jgi:hypothetical protein
MLFNGLSKNAPACPQAGISGVSRLSVRTVTPYS